MCGEASPVPSVYEMHKNNTLRTSLIKNKNKTKRQGYYIVQRYFAAILSNRMQFTQCAILQWFIYYQIREHHEVLRTSEQKEKLKAIDRCRQQKTHT